MKIHCSCGKTIHDSSDCQSFKASIIAEQDEEDFIAEGFKGEEQASDAFIKFSKTLYQCDECGRLILDAGGRLLMFKPESTDYPLNILRSVEGEQWRRHLRGKWDGSQGEVWWGFGVDDEGFMGELSSKEDVEKMYFEVFNRLVSKKILRDSFLSIENKVVHSWSESQA